VTSTAAIIVAAGKGERAGGAMPKQFRRLAGRAVVAHAYDRLAAHPAVAQIVVVTGHHQRDLLASALESRAFQPAEGGATRRESVLAGLRAAEGADRVLIHDAARPFVPMAVLDRLLTALDSAVGVVPVLPVADTLAGAGAELGPVLDRSAVLRVQTPQAFRYDLIRAAHEAWSGPEPTDDAQMLRAAGHAVATVQGDPMLDKITRPEDFAAAEARLGQRAFRTGMGFDVHPMFRACSAIPTPMSPSTR
jgi:2-C-methyl-D-erythritol 4-phosphate cytidylyltransferase / 2-C-methyl-D-erythritol 2,4-cyclodiphosphate synthase